MERQVGGVHYKKFVIQPAVFNEANGLSFLEGCIVKRICRWRDKGGVEDLEKIKHEVDMLIELENAQGRERQEQETAAAEESYRQGPESIKIIWSANSPGFVTRI